MITEVHAIMGFAHIKVKQTDMNKWCYIRKHAFGESCLMVFLVRRATSHCQMKAALRVLEGFFADISGRQHGDISVIVAIRLSCCGLHSGWKVLRLAATGRHVRLHPWSEYLWLRFKSTSEKTDLSGCSPFKAPLVINTKLKIAKNK